MSILILSFRILRVVITVTISPFLTVKVIIKCVVPEKNPYSPYRKIKNHFCITKPTNF